MADAWGGSWGSSWGVSWGSGSAPVRTDRGGDGFGHRKDRNTPERKRRREQYLKRALAAFEAERSRQYVPTEEQEISPAEVSAAIETIEAVRPSALVAAQAIQREIPDYMALPRQMQANHDARVAAIALWMMQEAQRRAEQENEADEEEALLLLAMI